MKPWLLAALIGLPLLSSAADDSQFVGQWVRAKPKTELVEITRNGSSHIVRTVSNILPNRPVESKLPARLEGDHLIVDLGGVKVDAVVEQKTGLLLFKGGEYRRLSPNEAFEIPKVVVNNPFNGGPVKR